MNSALKWHDMERRPGRVNYAIVDAILAWTDRHEIPLRGHNIFWGIPNRVQPWLKEMDDVMLKETLKARALDIGSRYRWRFAEYDLNNEMLHANYYADRLGPGITKQMADWVKQADPNARLFFNDYDILTGNRLDDYIKHIRGLLEQGTPMDGIGVQGHLHGETFDPNALQLSLNELAKIGLTIRITEVNMPGQRSVFMKQRNLKLTPHQEQAKAKNLTDYYRICFSPVFAISPRLDAHARGRGLSQPCLQRMVDGHQSQSRQKRPMPPPRLLRQMQRDIRRPN